MSGFEPISISDENIKVKLNDKLYNNEIVNQFMDSLLAFLAKTCFPCERQKKCTRFRHCLSSRLFAHLLDRWMDE